MTAESDDRLAAGLAEGDTTDQGAPPSMEVSGPRSLQTSELLLNPRARARLLKQPTPEPILPATTTTRERPARRAAGTDDPTDETPFDDALAISATMPGRPSAELAAVSVNSLITKPAWSSPRLSSADEIAARVRAREPAFPLPNSNHYEYVRFLGEGGMGKVFLAKDLRLGREVAIKFVRGDSRDHTLRLLNEARAQAQVNHDRVCKVFEVDEVDGQVYIAMQYIDGEPLGSIVDDLTIEQLVMVVRDAAEGVHAAHRVGIVHRDLNPNNIMVERDHDGRLRSYVMDFGLARDRNEGATETGTVMGTPHYMSPEQARGEVGRLDRRADIYSLGASLYVLLTGQQAIPGDNGLVVLNNIQLVEPRRLRAIDPDIPVDLEAITLRCLEKERSARYDSARALAEDLGRFLDGEPVHARRAGLGYRLRKRVRKHWRLMAAAALVLALLIAALGWGVRARRDSQDARRESALRERLAREFAERVEGIEASARYSALARLHDIRADRRALRARMDELAVDVALAGPLARGPGHYALGRGLLALGEPDRAREELQDAWDAGYTEPRVAYALALVLGGQYQQRLLEAERLTDEVERAKQKLVIEKAYRDPALHYLKLSRGESSTEYVSALIAFYEDRFDDALASLDAMGDRAPWFYERDELRGDLYLARALKAARVGERDRAVADFEAGRRAYAAAIATAESVPDLHVALATLEQGALDYGLLTEADVEAPFARGIAATERALAVLPDHDGALVMQSTMYRRMAEFRGVRGVPIDDLIQHALTAVRRAVDVAGTDPTANAMAWGELSRVYWTAGEDRERRGDDPSEQLRQSIAASDRVPDAKRDDKYYLGRGLAFKVWADYQDSAGVEAQANRGKAIEAYEHALALSPDSTLALINLGANYFERASQPRAVDPDHDLAAAAGVLDRALAINAKHAVAHFYQAKVSQAVATRVLSRGGDPRPELSRALEHYRAGIAINPALPYLYNGAGLIILDQATDAWNRGGDPVPMIGEARAYFERAVVAAPEQWYGTNNLGEAWRRLAELQRAGGADATVAARAALAAFEHALAASPEDGLLLSNTGRARVLIAGAALTRGGDPEPILGAAEAAFAKVLAENPANDDALLGRASMLSVRAQARARKGAARDQDFIAAADAFAKAVELAPDDQDVRLEAGRLQLAWAAWVAGAGHDPSAALTRGLALADELLTARATWASARALRGSLLVLEAQATAAPDARRAIAQRAAGDFTAALAGNPNLESTYRGEASRAQQLAAPP